MNIARAHLYISGKVQGVYFRHHTREKAEELGLKGWVRNLPDRRVEAVFEGDPRQVHEMIRWCRIGPPHANVTGLEELWEDPTTDIDSFTIRQ